MSHKFVFFKEKREKNRHKRNVERFIIKYNHQTSDLINDEEYKESCLDIRRVVFVSLHGLYNTWKKCPSHVLFSAILIMPLSKEWVYDPSQYQSEWDPFLSVNGISMCLNDNKSEEHEPFSEFLQLLRWKDSQGLALFMVDKPDNNEHSQECLIAPFWKDLSMRLTAMYDPVTGGTYQPLQCEEWWKHRRFESKFGTKASSVLTELYFVQMKFKCIQEIVYQSNPKSLNPITFYGLPRASFIRKSTEHLIAGLRPKDTTPNDGDWYVSTDYDPYDLL